MKGSLCKLIIDARERNVTRHETEFTETSHEIKQITTADYAIIGPDGNILIAIERKSLEDFAASLKDGRSDNISKLIKLRELTNCRIIYIIEGPAYPSPDSTFGRIPYRYIESAVFHLMVRDDITVIHTESTLGTAKMLARLVTSMDNLVRKGSMRKESVRMDSVSKESTMSGGSSECVNNTTTNDNSNNEPAPTTITTQPTASALDLLTAQHKKTDHELVREMWSCFAGISVESADEYMKSWTLADIICDRIPRDQILGFKMANGRKVSKKVVAALTGVNKTTETRILAKVEGVSSSTASELMNERPLRALLGYGAEGISMCKFGKSQRCLGKERAERIIRLFNYKLQF